MPSADRESELITFMATPSKTFTTEDILNREQGRGLRPLKVHCRLISCQTYNEITSTEIEKDTFGFGITKDNPFPASRIWTGNFYADGTASVTYIVNEAFGDHGTWEPEAVAA